MKRIVCLANSRKLHGRCVAGREWNDGQVGRWIRPVSDREHQEVSEYERQYEDGSDPQVLDVIDVPLVEPRPRGFQSENWLLDAEYYWERAGRLSWFDLPQLADSAAPLWLDGHSTYHGRNDKIPLEIADSVGDSLKLIHVDDFQLSVFKPGEAFGNTKRRVQGRFSYGGNSYCLWVTDPVYERQYLAKLDGTYSVGECFLTVSLGEPFGGAVYKLVASIIAKQLQ
ncbi:MAG: hypothetical protein OXK73_00830 [Rhodospirillaceae bacterium]|nr:hypothetical protein [Rhodospirillaceae bacterium]